MEMENTEKHWKTMAVEIMKMENTEKHWKTMAVEIMEMEKTEKHWKTMAVEIMEMENTRLFALLTCFPVRAHFLPDFNSRNAFKSF